MAYDRYDNRRGGRGEPSGHSDERRGRDFDRDGDRYSDRGREEDHRGFLDRASDEIASWWGDEEAERRRRRDERMSERGGWSSGRDEYRRDYRPGDLDRADHDRHEDRTFQPMNWTTSNREYRSDYENAAGGDRDYEPMAGDYARGADYGPRHGYGPRDYERRDDDRSSEWDRDEYRRTSFAGSAAHSNRQDAQYDECRRREMEQLDRDYDDYRRENQSRFESDFEDWRRRREGKRQMLGQIREHMEVVGSDGEHLGTVDRVAGDRIILTKSDPEAGGVHHSISCTMIDRIDDDRVVLEMDADRAKDRWRDENRERALFEREDQGRAGPHMLGRSFSGTYR